MFLSFLAMRSWKAFMRYFLNYFTFFGVSDSLKFYFYYKMQNIVLKDRRMPLKIDYLKEDRLKTGFPSIVT